VPVVEPPMPVARSSDWMEAPDAAQIARTLTEKYGIDALAFAHQRAERAASVGDELALAAWHSVIAATQNLLWRGTDA
jgi:hypothetical protein